MRRAERNQAVDLQALDHVPQCPDCHDLAHPAATVCESCGQHLFVRTPRRPQITVVFGCTCADCGVCVACVLASYERGEAA